MRIKDISKENRPRERMQTHGSSVLSEAELLAIILKTGTKEENVIDMSNRIISKYGIDKLSSCSLKELQGIKGIGKAKSCQILASFELNKRSNSVKYGKNKIESSKDVYDYISPKLSGFDKEHFMILHLDTKNRVIKNEIVSVGTLNSSLIHPREVFKSAIKESANAIILVHNHPSDDTAPSEEDKKITQILFDAGKILNIKVLDHIIIGNEGHYSFKEKSEIFRHQSPSAIFSKEI